MSAGSMTQSPGPSSASVAPEKRSRLRRRADDPRRLALRSGLPVPEDVSQPWPKRLLKRKLFWLTLVMIVVYATLLTLLYQQVVPDQDVPGGRLIGLGEQAVPIAAKYAAFTAVPLSLLFIWADRFRPQRFWVWFMTIGWGACVATFAAAQINTWAAGHLSILGDGDPASGARAAVYVAPFVEEACKGTVLFWLAILMRYRWVSRISGIVLAGLTGTAFAFTENILYYGRAYRYAAQTFGEVSPEQALNQLFFLRGVMTFFGHPLFTSMTGIGLAIALRSKSKIVRVVAPLAGYCAGSFLHMTFNASSTLAQGNSLLIMYFGVALPLVAVMVVFFVRQLFRENRLIRERLTDYVRVGWLPESDVAPLARLRTRLRAVWHGLFLGWGPLRDTILMQRAVTELAYLRDSIARGLVDQAGLEREKYLLARIRMLRPQAVTVPTGRASYPKLGRRTKAEPTGYQPASYPGPAGIGGNYPAVPGSAPIGPAAVQYSEVDPQWKPPGS